MIPYPASVLFGKELPESSTPAEVRIAVCELSCESFNLLKGRKRTLNARFVRRARQFWFRRAISDTAGKELSFGNVLVGAIALGDVLRTECDAEEEMVGIVLPASVGGALANIAVTLMGRIPVNLNFTASTGAVASAIEQCKIRTVISSRQFVDKVPGFTLPEGTLFLEDLVANVSTPSRVKAVMKSLFYTPRALAGGRRIESDDVATIIFSSGSTGEPKGVMLSHHNLLSNVEAIQLVFKFEPQDRFCAVLHFFHSFGLTATLWTPVICGFSAHYHPNPMDGAIIGEMVREQKLTTMVATPTFLLAYIRRAGKDDFKSLRAVCTGAEKLKPRVADAFEAKFGIRPMEGYGATELSPVGAMSVADIEIEGVPQIGTKPESVGHPVLGVAARIVDPDSLEAVTEGCEGLLQIKGPNVMLGYLGEPGKTSEVLCNGWYSTGDIARIDSDGFVFLLDRLSRYSKIGGEMVPHMAVEDVLIEGVSTVERCIVVTAAPDDRKGEQLVVCHTEAAGPPAQLFDIIKASDLPNLWKPKKDNFVLIETVPVLGSGKLDLKAVKDIARTYCEMRPNAIQRVVTKLKDSL